MIIHVPIRSGSLLLPRWQRPSHLPCLLLETAFPEAGSIADSDPDLAEGHAVPELDGMKLLYVPSCFCCQFNNA